MLHGYDMKSNNKPELFAVNNAVIHNEMHYSQLKKAAIMMVDDEPIMLEIIHA